MRRVAIVRHGNTFAPGEPPRRIGSATDLPLVESGRAQARALAEHFAENGLTFDRIITSPLRRTRETAALIANRAPVETADWLREIDHGPDENRPEEAVLARIGAPALAAWESEAAPPPGWIVDADARIAAWRRLLEEVGNESWLIVTSNGAARFALVALGQAPAKLRTGAYGVVAGDPWRVDAWDRRPA